MKTLLLVLVLLVTTPAVAQEAVTILDPFTGQPIQVAALPEAPADAHDAKTHAAIGTLIAAHMADLATTMYFIGKCGAETGCATEDGTRVQATEANPVLAPYSHNPIRFALVKWGVAAGTIGGIYALHQKHPKLARWMAYSQAVAIFVVAMRNQQLLETTR